VTLRQSENGAITSAQDFVPDRPVRIYTTYTVYLFKLSSPPTHTHKMATCFYAHVADVTRSLHENRYPLSKNCVSNR